MNKTIAYVTDLHLEEDFPKTLGVDAKKNWEVILSNIKERLIDHIVFGGDIGDKSAHQWFFNTLKGFELDISLGNHDHFHEIVNHIDYQNTLSNSFLYYSKEYDSYKIICMDSSNEIVDQEQLAWLSEQLTTHKTILLFIHHPILEVNALIDKQFALKERHKLKNELLKVNNQIVVFSGHYHLEDITIEANIKQCITSASSYQVEKTMDKIALNTATFGYRLIEISPKAIQTQQILFS